MHRGSVDRGVALCSLAGRVKQRRFTRGTSNLKMGSFQHEEASSLLQFSEVWRQCREFFGEQGVIFTSSFVPDSVWMDSWHLLGAARHIWIENQ